MIMGDRLQSFIEYQEYELYNSWTIIDPVPSRDLHVINMIFPLPSEFTLFDADVGADGKPGSIRHNEVRYVQADRVTALARFQQYHEPIVAAEKQRLTTRFGRFSTTFLDDGFSLRRSFRAALAPARPFMDDYIQRVESAIRTCREQGLTHVAWSENEPLTSAVTPITSGLQVYNRDLTILNP